PADRRGRGARCRADAVAPERQGAGGLSRPPRAHERKSAMGGGPRSRLPRAGALRDGHRATPAQSRAGQRLAAVERPIHGPAAGTEHRGLPRPAAGRLRALLRSEHRLRDLVVAGVSPGVLAAVVSAPGGVRLDELLRAHRRLAPAANRAPDVPGPAPPSCARHPAAAAGDPEPSAGAAVHPEPRAALHPEPYCPAGARVSTRAAAGNPAGAGRDSSAASDALDRLDRAQCAASTQSVAGGALVRRERAQSGAAASLSRADRPRAAGRSAHAEPQRKLAPAATPRLKQTWGATPP